jgi:hypothetical protein
MTQAEGARGSGIEPLGLEAACDVEVDVPPLSDGGCEG